MLLFLILLLWEYPRDCSATCKIGYYYLNEQCLQCPNNCISCASRSTCTMCNTGFYGDSCSLSCPDNCYNNECNSTSGQCLACMKGYFLDDRSSCLKCPDTCLACTSKSHCFACAYGFKGEYCQNTCSNCKTGTSCDKNTGYCLNDCNDGLSGTLCDTKCNIKCLLCNRLNENECITCAPDMHGALCNHACPSQCLNNRCNVEDGACTHGCFNGFWGKQCDNKCSFYCKDNACNISNGGCVNGCIDGYMYTGTDCSKIIPLGTNVSYGLVILWITVPVIVIIVAMIVLVKGIMAKETPNSDSTPLLRVLSVLKCQAIKETDDENNGSLEVNQNDKGNDEIVNLLEIKSKENKETEKQNTALSEILVHDSKPPNQTPGNDSDGHQLDTSFPSARNLTTDRNNAVDKQEDTHSETITKFNMFTETIKLIQPNPSDFESAERNESTSRLSNIESDDSQHRKSDASGKMIIYDEIRNEKTTVTGNSIQVTILAEYVAEKRKSKFLLEFQELSQYKCKRTDSPSLEEYQSYLPQKVTQDVLIEENLNYINFLFINGYRENRTYISYNEPVEVSSFDRRAFWNIVLQERCSKIVIFNQRLEMEEKCSCDDEDLCSTEYGDINVACHRERNFQDFTARKFTIKTSSKEKDVIRFHFTALTTSGLPDDVDSFVNFFDKVSKFKAEVDGPTLVYHSGEIDISGTYIALDILTKEGIEEDCVNIVDCVRRLWEQRLNCFHTFEQYEFLHQALVRSLTSYTTTNDQGNNTTSWWNKLFKDS